MKRLLLAGTCSPPVATPVLLRSAELPEGAHIPMCLPCPAGGRLPCQPPCARPGPACPPPKPTTCTSSPAARPEPAVSPALRPSAVRRMWPCTVASSWTRQLQSPMSHWRAPFRCTGQLLTCIGRVAEPSCQVGASRGPCTGQGTACQSNPVPCAVEELAAIRTAKRALQHGGLLDTHPGFGQPCHFVLHASCLSQSGSDRSRESDSRGLSCQTASNCGICAAAFAVLCPSTAADCVPI